MGKVNVDRVLDNIDLPQLVMTDFPEEEVTVFVNVINLSINKELDADLLKHPVQAPHRDLQLVEREASPAHAVMRDVDRHRQIVGKLRRGKNQRRGVGWAAGPLNLELPRRNDRPAPDLLPPRRLLPGLRR